MDKAKGFIGFAGARFVMIKQLRASGGMWLNYDSIVNKFYTINE